jgi:hypothetical protein
MQHLAQQCTKTVLFSTDRLELGMEMLVDVRGRQNRFWMGLGYRLAPRQCSSRHAAQEERSQAEPVPVQPHTVPIRRPGSKKKGTFPCPFSVFTPGEASGTSQLHAELQAGRLDLPEGYERQTEKTGAKQQHTGRLGSDLYVVEILGAPPVICKADGELIDGIRVPAYEVIRGLAANKRARLGGVADFAVFGELNHAAQGARDRIKEVIGLTVLIVTSNIDAAEKEVSAIRHRERIVT